MTGAFIEKVDELKAGVSKVAVASVQEYFKERPSLRSMLAWLEVRNEREIGAAQMISQAVVKIRGIDKKILVSLGKFIWDETRHYRDLSRQIERMKEGAPKEETARLVAPEAESGWWETLWRNVEKEQLTPFAGFYVSEGSALSITDPLVTGLRKYGYNELADLYTKIGSDEEFHVALDREMIKRYVIESGQQDLVMETATDVAEYLSTAWASIFQRKSSG